MTDMREAVARALCDVAGANVERAKDPDVQAWYLALADAAIAAARPYIRVAERERCAQEAEGLRHDRATNQGERGFNVICERIAVIIRSLNND